MTESTVKCTQEQIDLMAEGIFKASLEALENAYTNDATVKPGDVINKATADLLDEYIVEGLLTNTKDLVAVVFAAANWSEAKTASVEPGDA